jgi:NitT/TauT family transport system ATP-binding protein
VLLSDRILVMSGQPGRIDTEIVVDLPRPRTDAIKSSPAYLALVERILARLGH